MKPVLLLACVPLLIGSGAVAQITQQRPVGQATTYDAGINWAGRHKYIVHGYQSVSFENTGNGTKIFEDTLSGLITALPSLDHVQADLSVTGFTGFPRPGSMKIIEVTPDNATGNVKYKIAVKGRGSISQLQYTLYVTSTEAVTPWPPAKAQQPLQYQAACIKKSGHGHLQVDFSSPFASPPTVTVSFLFDKDTPEYQKEPPKARLAVTTIENNAFVFRSDREDAEIGLHKVCYVAVPSVP